MNVKHLIKQLGMTLQKNSPYILTGLGCAGVVSTAVMTGKAAVKAHDKIQQYTLETIGKDLAKNTVNRIIDENHSDLSLIDLKMPFKEKVKLTWKYFIPPTIMGATSVACIIGAQTVNTRRHAAIASLYSLTESTLKDYQQKVVELVGEKKEQIIRDDISQKRIDENPVSKNEVIITGKGEMLCYDTLSGRYFKSDIETLRRIQNDFNHEMMSSMWVSLNDLYFAMGLSTVKIGDELGWTVDELLDFRFSSKLTDNGEPCLVLNYNATPKTFRRI